MNKYCVFLDAVGSRYVVPSNYSLCDREFYAAVELLP